MKEVKATPEWHWFCPKCERSCMSRIKTIYQEPWNIIECPDCGEKYKVLPQNYEINEVQNCGETKWKTEDVEMDRLKQKILSETEYMRILFYSKDAKEHNGLLYRTKLYENGPTAVSMCFIPIPFVPDNKTKLLDSGHLEINVEELP